MVIKNKYLKYVLILIITLLLLIIIVPNIIYFVISNFNSFYSFNIIKLIRYIINNPNILFGILILECLFFMFILSYKYNFNVRNNHNVRKANSNEFGSSRFTTDKEIKKEFTTWKFNKENKKGGMVVAIKNGKYYVDTSSNHTLIIGNTGSGKTVSVIDPLIFNLADSNESMIINDVKGELYKTSYDYLIKKGYDVKVLNLRDSNNSDLWNPLKIAYEYYKSGNKEKAIETVNDLSSAICDDVTSRDKYWQESSSSVLSALSLALIEDCQKENEVHFSSIYNLLVEHGAKKYGELNSLDSYFNDRPFGNTAKNLYSAGNFARGETRATIFSILAAKLRVFGDQGISYITSNTSFNIRDVGVRKTAIFLIIPDERISRHFIGSLFINQIYQVLVEEAQKYKNGMLPYRVNFILDEFSNMVKISEFSKKLTVARSRNIRFYLVIQDFNQLQENYSTMYETIKSNCSNWVYLLTNSYSSALEISKRLGKYTIITSRTSTSNSYGKLNFHISSDNSLTGRDLKTTEELINFKLGEAIVLRARMHPIKTKLKQINDYPIKFITTDKIEIKNKQFNKVDYFDLDLYRLAKNLSNDDIQTENVPKKINPMKRKKKNG